MNVVLAIVQQHICRIVYYYEDSLLSIYGWLHTKHVGLKHDLISTIIGIIYIVQYTL